MPSKWGKSSLRPLDKGREDHVGQAHGDLELVLDWAEVEGGLSELVYGSGLLPWCAASHISGIFVHSFPKYSGHEIVTFLAIVC